MVIREWRANWLSGVVLEGGGGTEGVCTSERVRKRLSVLIKVQTDAVERSKNSQKGPKTAGSIPPVIHTHTPTHELLDTHGSCCSYMVNEPLFE